MLGYPQPLFLENLEQRAGRLSADVFDIILGCSVGAITAAALSIRVPASVISAKFFKVNAPEIFDPSWLAQKEDTISQAWGTKYSSAKLLAALNSMLGSATLRDCKTRFCAISYDFASDRPVYFKSYENSSQDDFEIVIGIDSDITLAQVCLASAAAESYFPGVEYIEPELNSLAMLLLDGGNTGDNAPDMVAISEMAYKNRLPLPFTAVDDIEILSLGTGSSAWAVTPSDMKNPSILTVGNNLSKIVFSVGEDTKQAQASKLLGGNHFHVGFPLSTALEIDDASDSALMMLEQAAATSIAVNIPIITHFSI